MSEPIVNNSPQSRENEIYTIVTQLSVVKKYLPRRFVEQFMKLQIGEHCSITDQEVTLDNCSIASIKDVFAITVNDEVRYFIVMHFSVQFVSDRYAWNEGLPTEVRFVVMRLSPESREAMQLKRLSCEEESKG